MLTFELAEVLTHIILLLILFILLPTSLFEHGDISIKLILLKFPQLVFVQKAPLIRLLIENVPELLNSLAFTRARDLLEQASYQMLVLRVNAACCGVAQIRRRVFVIGVLGGSELMQQIETEARSYSSTPADAPTVKHCIASSSDTYYHPARTAHSACVRSTD